ncbi:MAG: LPS assembly protein LptD [Proteobacteria bacterium]|nr:LPS-assembly protein LptD [Pseudomonadota bacterium]NOG59853.1 LPS assembly protein LptD [Pseudomonadota bacterium]
MKAVQNTLVTLFGGILLSSGAHAAELGGDYKTLLCPQSLNIPDRPYVGEALDTGDIHLTADEADLVDGGVSTLTGNAEVTKDSQQVTADIIEYNQPNETADLDGNINYWDEALFLKSNEAYLQFDNGIGEFTDADYILKDSRTRGTASKLVLDVGTRTEMEDVGYTTCDPDDEFWKLTADKITLDHEENWGKARNVVLRIKDFPVFYSPYMSFPLNKERKSGFLAPGYGNTNRHGFEVRTPYYWNISPNMDATLTPRLLTDSGVMAMGEYRYLFSRASGEINFEYLPSDSNRQDKDRNALSFTHRQQFLDTGSAFFTYNRVSDKFYFEDFGSQLSTTSTRFLERRAEAFYSGNNWNVTTRVQDYQTVDRSIVATSRPYKRLPQILFNYGSPRTYGKLNYGVGTEAVYFERGDDNIFTNTSNDNVNGLRAHIQPYISYPMRTVATFLEPKLSLDYTQYNLEDSANFTRNPSRVLPVFSLDSGLFLERETQISNTSYLQTLEPRLFYLYTPNEDQSDLPVFDTGQLTNSFDLLFREDRFSGHDRRGDANQLTFALTSHLINQETGRDLGHVSVGQIFYFQDRKVTLPGGAVRDEDGSAFIAEFDTKFIKNWNIGGDIIYDPNIGNSTQKITAQATYNPAPGKILNLAYRIRRDGTDIEQSDISFRWPVAKNWNAVGRWNYAVPEGRSLETFAGLEYESCCWGARVVARRFLTDINGEFDTGIFLQLELKGLAGIGKKTVDFLKQQIPGYQSEF